MVTHVEELRAVGNDETAILASLRALAADFEVFASRALAAKHDALILIIHVIGLLR